MSNKPTHFADVVTDPKERSERKAQWRPAGAVWPHKNGNGFDLMIPAGNPSPAASSASNARTNSKVTDAMAPPITQRGFLTSPRPDCVSARK